MKLQRARAVTLAAVFVSIAFALTAQTDEASLAELQAIAIELRELIGRIDLQIVDLRNELFVAPQDPDLQDLSARMHVRRENMANLLLEMDAMLQEFEANEPTE